MSKARKRKTFFVAMAFILPFFILYTVFTIWPVIQGFYVSLHKWGLMGKLKYVGFDNYTKFLRDKNFWGALKNTAFFTLITTPMLVITALVLALLANRATKMKKSLRVIFYLPSVLSVSIASLIAKYTFTPDQWYIACAWNFTKVKRAAVAAGSQSGMDHDFCYDSMVDYWL